MANPKGRGWKTTSRCYFFMFLWLLSSDYGEGEDQWYKGCYRDVSDRRDLPYEPKDTEQKNITPYYCVGLCATNGYQYAGVQKGMLCFCGNTYGLYGNVSRESWCNSSCWGNFSQNCGGDNYNSIYSAQVPTIVSVNIRAPFHVATNTSFDVMTEVVLKGLSNTSFGKTNSSDPVNTFRHISLTWRVGNTRKNSTSLFATDNFTEIFSSVYVNTIDVGQNYLCVNVSNLVTHSSDCTSFVALVPVGDINIVSLSMGLKRLNNSSRFSLVTTNTSVELIANINKGSEVEFEFDFGDDKKPLRKQEHGKASSSDLTCVKEANATHIYTDCGNYTVNITAGNAVSRKTLSLQSRFIVENSLSELRIDRIFASPRKETQIRLLPAKLQPSCNIRYKWNFGDNSEPLNTTVPIVSHNYSGIMREYTLTVKAWNSVSTKTLTEKVHVQEKLTGIKVDYPKVVRVNQEVTLSITVEPATETHYVEFVYHFKEEYKSYNHKINYLGFTSAGRHNVTVEVRNKINTIKETLHILVYEAITKVDLSYDGPTRLGRITNFTATMSPLVDATYKWTFGNNKTVVSRSPVLSYNYKQAGRYRVTVVAKNAVSSAQQSIDVFVARILCTPPQVEISGEDRLRTSRGRKIRFEAVITFSCRTANSVMYEWKIWSSSTDLKVDLKGVVTTDLVLLIPPYMMEYGTYTVVFKVWINNTVYSAEAQKLLTVTSSRLVAAIAGGTIRVIGYDSNEIITIDAGHSYDPDNPKKLTKLKFDWNCHPLNGSKITCFEENHNINSTQDKTLTFPIQKLKADIDAFEFVVTVSAQGRKESNASQVFIMAQNETHILSLDCAQCHGGDVNPSTHLSFVGVCHTCPKGHLTDYSWELYYVENRSSLPPFDALAKMTCADPSGKGWNDGIHGKNNHTGTPAFMTTVTPTTRQTTDTALAPTGTLKVVRKCFLSGQKSTSKPATMPSRRHPLYPHGKFSGTKRISFGSRIPIGFGSGYGYGSGPCRSGSGSGQGSARFPITVAARGTGSYVGSGCRPVTGSVPPPNLVTPAAGSHREGSVFDGNFVPKSARNTHSIIRLPKRKLHLFPTKTLYGTRETNLGIKENIIIKPRFFKTGQQYLLAFKAKDVQNEDKMGLASVYFSVNVNPERGSCQISPEMGTEMETDFTLRCSGWSDRHTPLSYTLKYNLDDKMNETFYHGYRDKVQFKLPAGRKGSNYTVKVYVEIEDANGATMPVCPTEVTVKPKGAVGPTTIEEVLFNETIGRLLYHLAATDEQLARQIVSITAKILNRLEPVAITTSSYDLRVQTRQNLWNFVKNFTVRDEVSALQNCAAILACTNNPFELTEEGVSVAAEALQKISEQSITGREMFNDELVNFVSKIASNIIESFHYLVARQTRKQRSLNEAILVMKTIKAIDTVIKSRLYASLVGEKPITVLQPFIGVTASRVRSLFNSHLALSGVKIKFPRSIDHSLSPFDKCFDTVLTVYKQNPYSWSPQAYTHTKVASLNVNACKRHTNEVKRLNGSIRIELPWSNYWRERRTTTIHTVKQKYLNVHAVNIAEAVKNHALLVQLRLLNKLPVGFAIRLLLRLNKRPSFTVYNISRTTSGSSVELQLGQDQLGNGSGTLYVGILLEENYHFGRKKKGYRQPVFANYSLNTDWFGCLFWNETLERWRTNGCWIDGILQENTMPCRCNHLTAFSGGVMFAVNTLEIADLKNFTSLQSNPVCLAVVVAVFALYLILLIFCLRNDRIDKRKHNVVFLEDHPLVNCTQKYHVTVNTGHWFGSGTTAKVYLTVYGEDYTLDPIELNNESQSLFGRSSKDVFILSTPRSLGPVWKIHIWHDGSGNCPSWYLERVTIKDLSTGEKWLFECYKWLAVDKTDSTVDCEILGTVDKSTNFVQEGVKAFVDHHLWLSVAARPSYSRFTRAQRLTCCLSTLLSFMCLNAAFYQAENEAVEVLGPLDLNWRTVLSGVLCSLLVLPVNLLWIIIFRFSRAKRCNKVADSPCLSTEQTKSTILTTSPDDDLLSYFFLDQSLEALMYLRRLGERRKVPSFGSDVESLHSFSSDDQHQLGSQSDDSSSLGYKSGEANVEGTPTQSSQSAYNSCVLTSNGSSNETIQNFNRSTNFSQRSSAAGKTDQALECCYFPSWTVYLAWMGCVLTAIGSGFVTLWYGISFGHDISIRWLQSMLFALAESVIVSQSLIVLVALLYLTGKLNFRSNKVFSELEEDEDYTDLTDNSFASYTNRGFIGSQEDLQAALTAKRWSRQRKYLRPPPKNTLFAFRDEQLRKKACASYIRECVSSVVFLILACILASNCTTRNAFQINQYFKGSLARLSSGLGSENVYSWIDHYHSVLLDKFHWSQNNYTVARTASGSPGAPGNPMITMVIGRPTIHLLVSSSSKVCFKLRPGTDRQLSGLLGHHIMPRSNWSTGNVSCIRVCPLNQLDESVIVLNSSKTEARKQIRHLKTKMNNSGCIQKFHFTALVQTLPLNVFSVASFDVTSSGVGQAAVNVDVHTFGGFSTSEVHSTFLKLCKLMFLCCLLYFLQLNVFSALEERTKYFRSFWSWLEIMVLAVAGACVILYINWSVTLYAFIREMELESQRFLMELGNHLHQSQDLVRGAYGILIFLLVVKLIRLLRMRKIFATYISVIASAWSNAKYTTVALVIYVLAFVHSGYLLFGHQSFAFSSVSGTFLLAWSLFRVPGEGKYVAPVCYQNSVYSMLYIVLYLLGVVIILRALFAAAFMRSLKEVKKGRYKSLHLSNVVADFWSKLLSSLMWWKKKKTDDVDDDDYDDVSDEDEEDEIVPVEYTMSEVECQLEELNFRMNKLVGDSKLLANVSESEDDFSSLRGSDGEVEYLYRSPLYFQDIYPKNLAEREWLERGQTSNSHPQSSDQSFLSSTGYPDNILVESCRDSLPETDENRRRTFNTRGSKIHPQALSIESSSSDSFLSSSTTTTTSDAHLPTKHGACSPRVVYGNPRRHKRERVRLPQLELARTMEGSTSSLQTTTSSNITSSESRQLETGNGPSAPDHPKRSKKRKLKISTGKPNFWKPVMLTSRAAVFPDNCPPPTHRSLPALHNTLVCDEPDTSPTIRVPPMGLLYYNDPPTPVILSPGNAQTARELQPVKDVITSLSDNTKFDSPITSPFEMEDQQDTKKG